MRALFATIALVLVGAAAADGSQQRTVRLVQASPVIVVGSHFGALRTLTVRYRSGAVDLHQSVHTGRNGAFRVAFGGTTFTRCRGLNVAAGGVALIVPSCTAPSGRPALTGHLAGLVRGRAFVPGERIALTARASGEAAVTGSAQADATGSFVTHLDLPAAACAEVFYRAVGALGSQATVSVDAPDCKPK
jgi:hypothetical protein